jgi:hypothetical protein
MMHGLTNLKYTIISVISFTVTELPISVKRK